MRPGQQQQNKRMRGRGGRKGPNPLSRSFESNGPDVKIRGTAQHIADKYTTLARDAAAAGDRVMAENYLQHAEHYGRIVAAAQGQFQPSQPERDYADFDEDGDEEGQGPEMAQPYAGGGQDRPQNGYNGERHANGERHPNERQAFRDGQNGRGDRRDNRDNRENRGDRPFQNRETFARDGQNRDQQPRDDRRERDNRDNRQPGTGPQPFPQAAPEFDGEAGATRQDGTRAEGGRRESRRERARLNERGGERRFEERFGRQRPVDDERAETAAVQSETATEAPQAGAPAPVEAGPQLSPAAAFETPTAASVEPSAAAEGRGRGRRRRDTVAEEGAATAPQPFEATPEAPSAEVAPVPVRRRTAKPAAAPEAVVAAEDEAAPKRRAVRARRKKDDEEGDGERAPALITSDT